MNRAMTSLSLETGSLMLGGYGVAKAGYAFFQGAEFAGGLGLRSLKYSSREEVLATLDSRINQLNSLSGSEALTALGLKDGMRLPTSKALELGKHFLGNGYKEIVLGSGRYVSANGRRVFRMGTSDVLGHHGGGPHVNFETLIPHPSHGGKLIVDANFHIYLID